MGEVFKDQLEALERLCPNFKVANATIHYDESSPHMHLVGVAVADGFCKGMERQSVKTKVFTKESLAMLQSEMRVVAEKSLEKYPELFEGMELKTKERGRNKDIPKQKLDEYYKLEEELKEVNSVAKLISDEQPTIKKEKVKDGIFSSHEAIVIEGLSAKEVENVFKASSMQKNATEEARAVVQRGKADADLLRAEAQTTIKEAQNIVKNKTTIIEKAKEEAQKILEGIQKQYNEWVLKIQNLMNRQAEIESENKRLIQNAQAEKEKIIQQAYKEIGKEKLYNELNDMLGIVPQVQVMKAYNKLEEAWELYNNVSYTNPTKEDFEAFKRLDVDYFEKMDKTVQHRLYKKLADETRRYIKLSNKPHTKEEVLEQIKEKELIRERNHTLSR